AFSKARGVLGQSPKSLVATSETPYRRFLVLFCGYSVKKERRKLSQCKEKGSYLNKVASFLFCTAGASPRPTAQTFEKV
ncbi:MAG: hypothetical protein J6R46_04990, partial [Clostridia bacterium]|nr:hypothetical protein [Clostridia bacterium]